MIFIIPLYSQIPTNGLVAYYPFNSNTNDESGNGNNGTPIGGVDWVKDRFNNDGSACSFNGIDGYILVPHSPNLDLTGPMSVSCWVQSSHTGLQIIIGKDGDEGGERSWHVGTENNKLKMQAFFGGDWPQFYSDPTNGFGNWTHITVTYDLSAIKFYINGIFYGSSPLSYNLQSINEPIKIGVLDEAKGGHWYYSGNIDNIRIYNRALSIEEIQSIYNEKNPNEINVSIDIKPGSFPNSINCDNENGLIPVAILSSPEFDARTVDHTTVTFGPNGATEAHCIVPPKSKDKGLSSAGPCLPKRHEEDVDGDGDIDLVFHFQHSKTGLTCSDTVGILKGKTYDGTEIIGSDAIRPVPPENQPNPFVVNEPIPHESILFDNYPNPFNPSTSIRYGLPEALHVILSVYNTLGQRVALLLDEKQEAGYHEVTFDASRLTCGMYFYRLQACNFTSVK